VLTLDILAKVKECIHDLDEQKKDLSIIIQKCINICYLLDDLDNFIWLKFEAHDLRNEKESVSLDVNNFAKRVSVSYEKTTTKWSKQLSFYTDRRTVKDNNGNNQVFGASISWIEDSLRNTEMLISQNVVPEGLNQLDLKTAFIAKHEHDILLANHRLGYKTVLSNTRRQAYETLSKWERECMTKDKQVQEQVPNSKDVFIIHGHNEAKWRELEKLLKDKFHLNPIILQEQTVGGSLTIIEKFERFAKTCSYAFAIFTPDDIMEKDGKQYFQARPNVVFEIGWFTGKLGRNKVCMLVQNSTNMEIFSDFQGVEQKRFTNNVKELFMEIENELKEAGIIGIPT
jgi:predicted nucleotide-binding protein